jgi:hypothetical protein
MSQFIVMFRSRFSDAFPPKCPHLGPQDVERGVAEDTPSPLVESLLCALLGLVLNRKKPVELVLPSCILYTGNGSPNCAGMLTSLTLCALHRKGHYGRALEEAVQTQKSQWPRSWNYINPLHGGRSFNTMIPSERVSIPAPQRPIYR